MSELVTNKITPGTGSSDTVTLGDSGDTFTIPAGVTLAGSGAALTALPAANISGVIPPANLGTGTASASTFLNGSGAYSEAGGGKILQVKISPALTGTYRTSTSNVLADITGFSVAITPSAATSKIAVMVSGSTRAALTTANWAAGSVIAVLRDSTTLGGFTVFRDEPATGDVFTYGRCFSASFLDEPASTSSLTYKIQFAKYPNYAGMTIYIPAINGTNDLNHCRIIVMEVGA